MLEEIFLRAFTLKIFDSIKSFRLFEELDNEKIINAQCSNDTTLYFIRLGKTVFIQPQFSKILSIPRKKKVRFQKISNIFCIYIHEIFTIYCTHHLAAESQTVKKSVTSCIQLYQTRTSDCYSASQIKSLTKQNPQTANMMTFLINRIFIYTIRSQQK